MNNAIFLDGIAVYAFVVIFAVIVVSAVLCGAVMITTLRENYALKERNRVYAEQIEQLNDRLYKATYKPQEVHRNV